MRLFALVAILALVATACGGDTTATPGESADPGESEAPPAESADPGASEEPGAGGQLGTYTMGIFQDITTDNVWSYLDSSGSTVYNAFVLGPTIGAPYTTLYPGLEFAPSLADGELAPTTEEADGWVGEFALREGVLWSDGEPLTADDVVFTWTTARDFELTANWPLYVDADIIDAVEAVDDLTVRVTFNTQPGLGSWGPGAGVPTMPIMPEHFWAPVVEEAAGSDDPRTELMAASGAEAPSLGSTVFSERQEGSFAASVRNENYIDAGAELSSGGVTWTEGPHADEFQYPVYGGQEAAVLALGDGEVDLLLNSLGMQRGFQDQVQGNPDLTAIVNPTLGYRFLAFNHAREPMSDPAFRDALSALINKEFVTEQLLQGVAFPLYNFVPEGNEAWYNPEVAAEIKDQSFAGLEDNERRQIAIDLLTEAGYSWETAPEVAEDGTFTGGQGLIDPAGNPVPQLELVTPTASYDPLRATFANYISGVAQEMGIPIVAIPTDFNKIVADVFATDDDGYVSDFDMFILGYALDPFPEYHGSFFGTTGGSNNTQYSSEEFDELAAAHSSAQTVEEAYDLVWEMERVLARDKPHLPLFDTGILEFYNNRVQYPFTDTLSGLQNVLGLPNAVTAQ